MHIHTHTKRVLRNPNVNILLTEFFDFSNIILSLPDDCHKKTARNQCSQMSTHAIKYV